VGVPHRSSFVLASLSVSVVLAGLAVAVWRFRADDGLGGLGAALGGMLLMLFLAVRLGSRP
jgi:hypothetical protein